MGRKKRFSSSSLSTAAGAALPSAGAGDGSQQATPMSPLIKLELPPVLPQLKESIRTQWVGVLRTACLSHFPDLPTLAIRDLDILLNEAFMVPDSRSRVEKEQHPLDLFTTPNSVTVSLSFFSQDPQKRAKARSTRSMVENVLMTLKDRRREEGMTSFTVKDLQDLLALLPEDLPTNLKNRQSYFFSMQSVTFSDVGSQQVSPIRDKSEFRKYGVVTCCLSPYSVSNTLTTQDPHDEKALTVKSILEDLQRALLLLPSDCQSSSVPLLYSTDYFNEVPVVRFDAGNCPIQLQFYPCAQWVSFCSTQLNPFIDIDSLRSKINAVINNIELHHLGGSPTKSGDDRKRFTGLLVHQLRLPVTELGIIEVHDAEGTLHRMSKAEFVVSRFPHFLPETLKRRSRNLVHEHKTLAVDSLFRRLIVECETCSEEHIEVTFLRLNPQLTLEFLEEWFSKGAPLIPNSRWDYDIKTQRLVFTNQISATPVTSSPM